MFTLAGPQIPNSMGLKINILILSTFCHPSILIW